ncbi:MAG: FkbM family methyltransferase [Selenomonadaceae bacterium]|nr:FkbM family methyltransferase [Selenomonadaceae bacterium]
MRDFFQMAVSIEEHRQDVFLGTLLREGKKCGIFVSPEESAQDALGTVNQFRAQGMQIECVCVMEKAGYENIDVDVKIVLLQDLEKIPFHLDCMLMMTSRDVWRALYQYFQRLGLSTWILRDDSEAVKEQRDICFRWMKLYDAYALFQDEESRRAFRGAILGKYTGQLEDFYFASEPQYFLQGFLPEEGDIAIDGGAFDGATSVAFASLGANVHAFEMDLGNYRKCIAVAEKRNFTANHMGLWSDAMTTKYVPSESASYMHDVNGTEEANFIDLDSYVERNSLPRVDYIKLDVEGAELEALQGACTSIAKWKPKLAISAYHRPEDLHVLAAYIKSIRPDYELAFRHYRVDARNYWLTDEERGLFQRYGISLFVPTVWEMVLYGY